MNENTIVIAAFTLKAFLSLVALSGGIYAINKGVHLLIRGKGAQRSHSTIKVGKYFEMRTETVGGVLLCSSMLWVGCGWAIAPSLKLNGNEVVLRIGIPNSIVSVASLASGPADGAILKQPALLTERFKASAQKQPAELLWNAPTSTPPLFDYGSITTQQLSDGTYAIEGEANQRGKRIKVRFRPVIKDGKLVFSPVGLETNGSKSNLGSFEP
jgi:hypothetical protein